MLSFFLFFFLQTKQMYTNLVWFLDTAKTHFSLINGFSLYQDTFMCKQQQKRMIKHSGPELLEPPEFSGQQKYKNLNSLNVFVFQERKRRTLRKSDVIGPAQRQYGKWVNGSRPLLYEPVILSFCIIYFYFVIKFDCIGPKTALAHRENACVPDYGSSTAVYKGL